MRTTRTVWTNRTSSPHFIPFHRGDATAVRGARVDVELSSVEGMSITVRPGVRYSNDGGQTWSAVSALGAGDITTSGWTFGTRFEDIDAGYALFELGLQAWNTTGTDTETARITLHVAFAAVRDLVIGEDVQAFDANLDNVASTWTVASDGDLAVPAGWAVNSTGGLAFTAAGGTLLIEGTSASYDVDIESAGRIDLRADDVISLDADSDINLDAGSSSDVFVRRGGSIYARFDGGNQGLCVGTHTSTRYATTSLDVRRDSASTTPVAIIENTGAEVTTRVLQLRMAEGSGSQDVRDDFVQMLGGGTEMGTINRKVVGDGVNYSSASDARSKHAIEDMASCRERFLAVRARAFRWDSDDSREEGFIAQEVAPYFPDAVTSPPPDDPDAVWMIDRSRLVVPLWRMTTELDEALAAALDDNARLEQALAALAARVDALEAR